MLIKTKIQPYCPACGHVGTPRHQNVEDYYFNSPGTWSLTNCPQCQTMWLDPAPLAEEIGKAYANYHTHTSVRKSGATSTLRKISQKILHWRLLFSDLDYQSMVREQKKFRYLNLQNLNKGKMLDVGCGGGRFLYRMKRIGWQVEGVDFDAAATSKVQSKYGFPVHTGDLRDICLAANSYDLIVMSHSIEHVCDPVSLLREAQRLLKQGGRLVIVTPNSKSIAHRRFGVFWRGLEVPRHIQIFSLTGLKLLLEKIGFDIETDQTFAHGSEGIYYVSKEKMHQARSHAVDVGKQMKQAKIASLAEHRRLKKNPDIGEDLYISAINTRNQAPITDRT